jgi:hypothetical protein
VDRPPARLPFNHKVLIYIQYHSVCLLLIYLLALRGGPAFYGFFYYMTRIFTSIQDDIKKNRVENVRTGSNRRPERRNYESGVASSRTARLPAAPWPPPAASRLPSSAVSTTTFSRKSTASGLTSSLVLASASGRIPCLEGV